MSKSSYRARTGHERYKFVKKNSNGYAKARRKVALSNLLASLSKIEASNQISTEPIDLSKDTNYQRIKKEISILQQKD